MAETKRRVKQVSKQLAWEENKSAEEEGNGGTGAGEGS